MWGLSPFLSLFFFFFFFFLSPNGAGRERKGGGGGISLRILLESYGVSLERTVTDLKGIHCLDISVNISVRRSALSSIVLSSVMFSPVDTGRQVEKFLSVQLVTIVYSYLERQLLSY